jgi:hypothetical protein
VTRHKRTLRVPLRPIIVGESDVVVGVCEPISDKGRRGRAASDSHE